MRITLISTLTAIILGCSSCFTGIESTPKITRADAIRAGVGTTDEQRFAQTIAAEAPAKWTAGKQWKVSDDKIGIIFAGAPVSAQNLAGKFITLRDVRPVTNITGEEDMELTFVGPDWQSLTYRTGISATDWKNRKSVEIPFAVEMGPVNYADSLMRGETFYITTPSWFYGDGQQLRGLRHIPVHIERVEAGTSLYPLKVVFTPREGDDHHEYYLLLTYGNAPSATRNFEKYFSFANPRKRYPQITDETWARIVRSQVQYGMTRDEVRLAFGAPNRVEKGTSQGSMQMERWSYDDGVYLIFEDGYLNSFRR